MSTQQPTAQQTPQEVARIVYEETAAALRHMPGGVWPGWDHLTPKQRVVWVRYGRGKQLRYFPAALKAMGAAVQGERAKSRENGDAVTFAEITASGTEICRPRGV